MTHKSRSCSIDTLVVFFVASCALCGVLMHSGCGELSKKMREAGVGLGYLIVISDSVSAMVSAEHISVNEVNGSFINITLTNSSYADSSRSARQDLALRIGDVTHRIMNKKVAITGGKVEFVSDHSFLVFHSSSTSAEDMQLSRFEKSDSIARRPL